MKKLIASVALAAASLGGPALAADMPLKAPPPIPYYSWTGCYVGLFAGTNSGRATVNRFAGAVEPAGQDAQYNLSGFLGGADVGCNYQIGAWVLGVEGDWAYTNKDGQGFDAISTVRAGPALGTPLVDQTHEKWLATARARIGYTVTDKWLWYVTGGGAWASVQQSKWAITAGLPAAGTGLQQQTMGGWVVGVGTEYAVGYGWSIKSEFLYVDLGSKTFFGPGSGIGAFTTFPGEDVKVRNYIWKVGMNKKFDWWSPVVAKY